MKGSYTASAVRGVLEQPNICTVQFHLFNVYTRELRHAPSHFSPGNCLAEGCLGECPARDTKQIILVSPQTGSKAVVLGDLE